MNLIEAIQKQVDKISRDKYKDKENPVIFIVSVLYSRDEEKRMNTDGDHKIALTIQHYGLSFTKVIFPDVKSVFGYEDLAETMEYMYNRTM